MALELNPMRTESRKISPPADVDISLSGRTLEKLGLPEEIIKDKALIASFLSAQSARLTEMEQKPELKTLSGEIPPPELEDPRSLSVTKSGSPKIPPEDRKSLQDWSASLDISSPSSDLAGQVEELLRNNPQAGGTSGEDKFKAGDFATSDIVLSGQLQQEWSKKENDWKMFISSLVARKADPISILLAIASMMTDKYGMGIRQVVNVYTTNEQKRRALADQFTREMGRGGTGGDLSRMTMFQNRQQTMMVDTQMINQKLQTLTQDRDRFQNITKEMMQSMHQTRLHISGRMPGGAG
ncbi:MAG: hypothetical protein HYS22_08485 [Deltaproteobacteria bacterium]|nr:hypothetical protein [Deltaproteobacteria bacterium]